MILLHVNNKRAGQPAHPRSLISAIVISFLEGIIVYLATWEISIFSRVSVAEQNGLSINWSKSLETGFLVLRPICYTYSKTCVKQPLKNRQNKDFNDKW